MESPSISTTEFIQNESSGLASPRVPSSSSASLISHLKESLQQAQNELNQQIFENSELKIYKSKYEDLENDYNFLSNKYDTLENEKKFSDIEITNLRKETEELSSQLFSEANNMVSQARKEAYNYKRINDTLKNENNEKDNLIHILKSQLTELKKKFENQDSIIETDNNNEINDNESLTINENDHPLKNLSVKNSSNLSINKTNNAFNINNFIYAPTVQSLRYDVKSYSLFEEFGKKFYHDFKSGLHKSNSKTSYLEIKEHKFYKKLIIDDIDPALRLDEAPGIAWMSKKSLVTSMLLGKVSIEPIAAINETYKSNNIDQPIGENEDPPVAYKEPCSLCGENRDDTLDHDRLYILKVIGTKTVKVKKDGSTITQNTFNKLISANKEKDSTIITQEYVSNQYSLCSYCLHRVRSVCELFAFLRGIKAGIWKFDNDLSCQKNWIECVRIRTKIYYSRIGIIESTNNLINNNSFSFNNSQLSSNRNSVQRNSGYLSSRISSPIMTNFNPINTNPIDESESTISTPKINNGYFGSRNSIIGNFWGSSTNNSPSPSIAPSINNKKKIDNGNNMEVFNQSSPSFDSYRLEGKIDEVLITTENGSPFKPRIDIEEIKHDPVVLDELNSKDSELIEVKNVVKEINLELKEERVLDPNEEIKGNVLEDVEESNSKEIIDDVEVKDTKDDIEGVKPNDIEIDKPNVDIEDENPNDIETGKPKDDNDEDKEVKDDIEDEKPKDDAKEDGLKKSLDPKIQSPKSIGSNNSENFVDAN